MSLLSIYFLEDEDVHLYIFLFTLDSARLGDED